MKALLLIAHGSRLQGANDEVRELVNSLRSSLGDDFDVIKTAFLELADPSISKAIDDLVADKVTEITVMPYFLNQGRHVKEDVPGDLAEKNAQYPDLLIRTLPYFGLSEQIPQLLVEIITTEKTSRCN